MKELLNRKKAALTNALENQKISKADMEEAQRRADEALNNYLVGCEQKYEQEKIKINAQLELIDELLNY